MSGKLRQTAPFEQLRSPNLRCLTQVSTRIGSLQKHMKEQNIADSEVKKITTANWQEPDGATALWRQMTSGVKTKQDWARRFLRPKFNSNVPSELASLLEVARATMIYSWYFYPLATLGMEQCYRVMDTGARIRCEQANVSAKSMNYGKHVAALVTRNIISSADAKRWEAMRHLRNSSSHPKDQTICDPGQAEGMLNLVVEFLNGLFR